MPCIPDGRENTRKIPENKAGQLIPKGEKMCDLCDVLLIYGEQEREAAGRIRAAVKGRGLTVRMQPAELQKSEDLSWCTVPVLLLSDDLPESSQLLRYAEKATLLGKPAAAFAADRMHFSSVLPFLKILGDRIFLLPSVGGGDAAIREASREIFRLARERFQFYLHAGSTGGEIIFRASGIRQGEKRPEIPFTQEKWMQMEDLCKGILVCTFPGLQRNQISMTGEDAPGNYSCALPGEAISPDGNGRFRFQVHYLRGSIRPSIRQDSLQLNLEENLDLFLLGEGREIFEDRSSTRTLHDFGIHERAAAAACSDLIRFARGGRTIQTEQHFRNEHGHFVMDFIEK